MPGQRTPAAARLGGPITRCHAALLLQSGIDSGGGVKDLRIHRVVPPSTADLDSVSTQQRKDSSSPECAAAAKPGPVESTPPEDVSATVAAAVEDLERKPVLPRSKLVRDPGSFGYRRLLPFLNQMAMNDYSNSNTMPSENAVVSSSKSLKRSRICLIDESAGVVYDESDPMEYTEPVAVKTKEEMKVGCDIVGEKTNTVPHDLAVSKPWLTRNTWSRIVHHKSSFSYKRMLPFLIENEISSQESERVKFRRVAEERQLSPDESDLSTSGNLATSEDSSIKCQIAKIENMEGEKPSNANGNCVHENRQLQPAVPKACSPECSAAEVHNVIQEKTCTVNQDPLASYEGESTEGIDILVGGQHELLVSECSTEECTRDVAKTTAPDKSLKLDGSNVLEPSVSEVSSLEYSTSEGKKAAEEQPITSDGEEGNTLTLDKGAFLSKEKPQLCETEELLTAQVENSAEFPQVLQCQSSDLGCPGVSFSSPTKTLVPLLNRCSLEHQDVMNDPNLDAIMISMHCDSGAVDRFLSVEEISGSNSLTESGSNKVGILQPSEALSLGKRDPSPRKLSPRKGILKRQTRGCKGICMCLDCSTYRLRADRAFEFSRKQMQEADDIIGNLLKEMANLRSLVEKPAGQRESIQAACQRAVQVEEVARDHCQQMFMDLNSHCRIPGPRVKFAQYVEELGSSPRTSKHRDDNMGSSPRCSSFSKRRCMKS